MKILSFILIALFITSVCTAQKLKESEVPAPVVKTFKSIYKDITKVEWGKEKDGKYEAEFVVNNIETSATFTEDGVLWETETEIIKSELPKSIPDYISKNYKGYKISEASKIINAAGATNYEAEIKRLGKHMDLLFDMAGNFLSKEKD